MRLPATLRSSSLGLLTAFSLAAYSGCGSDAGGVATGSGGSGGGAANPPSHEELEAYVTSERAAICEVFTGCCTEAERALATPIGALIFAGPEASTMEGCLGALEALFPATEQAKFLAAQIESGRATWDPTKVDGCVAAWANCTIPRVQRAGIWGEACPEPPVVPAGELGDSCQTVADCAEGTCSGAKGATVCTALAAIGEPCVPVSGIPLACAEGATCDAGTTTCKALVSAGEPCGGSNDCTTGECHGKPLEDGVCVEPTVCDGDTMNEPGLVLAVCGNSTSDPVTTIDCVLGTSSTWECTCGDATGPTSTCQAEFDPAQLEGDACGALGCCGF